MPNVLSDWNQTKANQTQEIYFLNDGRKWDFQWMYIIPSSDFFLMLINYQDFIISCSFLEKEDEKENVGKTKVI